jgi:hypothetical protein
MGVCLFVILNFYPMGACPPRYYVLVEVTNQVGKIAKTTIST